MKKKLLLTIFAGFLSVVMLGGCTWFTPDPTTPDPDDPDNPSTDVEEPVKESFISYFDKSIIGTYWDEHTSYEDQTGVEMSFDTLLNQQVDLLTQDIIYRLVSVYGAGMPAVNSALGEYGENMYVLTDLTTGQDYASDGHKAGISNYVLIDEPVSATSTTATYSYTNGTQVKDGATTVATIDASQPATYAYAFRNGSWDAETTVAKQYRFTQAMNGGYTYSNNIFNSALGNTSWAMDSSATLKASPDLSNPIVLYEDFYLEHAESIRLAIANILAIGSRSGYSYENAIQHISHLGFSSADKTNIKNYILNYVIGSSVVAADNAKAPTTTVSTSTVLSNDMHTYKAYSVIVPSMLEQAFANTFSETSSSIWVANVNRNYSSSEELDYLFVRGLNFTSLKITPKTTIPLTKLVLEVGEVSPVNLTISYSIYRSNTSYLVRNKSVARTTSSTITLDFSSYSSYSIGTSGYILISIENSADTDFSVAFDGYYDKV